MKTYKINGQIIYANKISDAIKTLKDSVKDNRYENENLAKEINRKFVKELNTWDGRVYADVDGLDLSEISASRDTTRRIIEYVKAKGKKVSYTPDDAFLEIHDSVKDDLGDRIAKYQKWVDYDMEKYHKISEDTMRMIKEAGLSVTKDQYGEYEVIAHSAEDSVDETGITSQKLSTPRGTFYIYKGTYRDFKRESDFDDWGLWFEHAEDDGSYYRIMHRAKDNHAIAVKVR